MKGAPAFRFSRRQAHPSAPRYDTLHVREVVLRFPVGGGGGGTVLVQPLADGQPAGDAYPVTLADLSDAPLDALLDWVRGRLPVDAVESDDAPVEVARVDLAVVEPVTPPALAPPPAGDVPVEVGGGLGRLG